MSDKLSFATFPVGRPTPGHPTLDLVDRHADDQPSFDYSEPELQFTQNPRARTKTLRADQLKAGDQMVWTSADGQLWPPRLITRPMVPRSTVLHFRRADDPNGDEERWTIRPHTEVRILDTTPVFNDWGEEGL